MFTASLLCSICVFFFLWASTTHVCLHVPPPPKHQVRGRDPGRLVADWLEALHDITRHRPRCCPLAASSSATANAAQLQSSSTTSSRPHRFGSFAPPRSSCPVSWYVQYDFESGGESGVTVCGRPGLTFPSTFILIFLLSSLY